MGGRNKSRCSYYVHPRHLQATCYHHPGTFFPPAAATARSNLEAAQGMVIPPGCSNPNSCSASRSSSPNNGWLKYTTSTTYRIDSPGSGPPTYTATWPLGVVASAGSLWARSFIRRARDRPHVSIRGEPTSSCCCCFLGLSSAAEGQGCRRRYPRLRRLGRWQSAQRQTLSSFRPSRNPPCRLVSILQVREVRSSPLSSCCLSECVSGEWKKAWNGNDVERDNASHLIEQELCSGTNRRSERVWVEHGEIRLRWRAIELSSVRVGGFGRCCVVLVQRHRAPYCTS
jgi:hypothetical protein